MFDSSVLQAIHDFYNIKLGVVPLGPFKWYPEVGKLIGLSGSVLFTGRWIIQMMASKSSGKPVLPLIFWHLSIVGSVLMLSYFVFGTNDSVGIVSNFFPLFIAFFNLFLELKHRAENRAAQGSTP
jgi:lipid-A-disaccharide synthase-like uncharacterized protein